MDSIDGLPQKDLFIVGDFNIDVNKKSNSRSKDILQNMKSYGLKKIYKWSY